MKNGGGVLQSRFNHYLALQVVRTELVNVGGEFEHHLILRSPADLSAQCWLAIGKRT